MIPGIDPGIDSILAKALAPLPENRYRSAREFHTDLNYLLAPPAPTPSTEVPAAYATPARSGNRESGCRRTNPALPTPPSIKVPGTYARKKSKAPLILGTGAILLIALGVFALSDYPEKLGIDVEAILAKLPALPGGETPAPANPKLNNAPLPAATTREPVINLPRFPASNRSLIPTSINTGSGSRNWLIDTKKLSKPGPQLKPGDVNLALAIEDEKAHVDNLLSTVSARARAPFSRSFHATLLPRLAGDTPAPVMELRSDWDKVYLKVRDELDHELNTSLQALESRLMSGQMQAQADAVATYRKSLDLPIKPASDTEYVSSIFDTQSTVSPTETESAPEKMIAPTTPVMQLEGTVWTGKISPKKDSAKVTLHFGENQVFGAEKRNPIWIIGRKEIDTSFRLPKHLSSQG